MARFALSAIGRDRPGIVAGVSAALLQHGANIEDSRMAILGGHFMMMLIVSTPPEADVAALDSELEETRARLGLGALTLEEVGDEHVAARPEPSHVVTVYGADHPGIVHSVASALAAADVNVLDVATHLVEEEGSPPLYVMMMEVAVPARRDPAQVEAELRAIAEREHLDLSMRAAEADTL